MPLSTYLATEFAKYAYTGTAIATQPTNRYVALHTADPGGTGTSEVSGSSYTRSSAVTLTRTVNVAKNSSAAVTFPTVTGSAYTVTHVSLWDASSTGNMLSYGELAVPKTLDVGDALSFAIDELEFEMKDD